MRYGYLLKISNKNIYKEVQIPVDAEVMKIGMGIDCDVRFYKESFFEDFELVLQKKSNEWNITCSDNVFIDAGDVRKLITKKLSHGDSFAIKYQKSENEVFKIDFVYDFDNENKDYSRVVDITSKDKITIGNSSNCNICINSEYVKNDLVELNKKNEGLILAIKSTTCGVYHNGNLAVNGEVIKNSDFFSIADFSFYYKGKTLQTQTNLIVKGLGFQDNHISQFYPRFIRTTRVKKTIDKTPIQILDPSSKPQKQRNNIITRLIPSIGMIVMCVLMAIISSQSSGGMQYTMFAFSGISGVMAIVTSIISIFQSKKTYNKQLEDREKVYKNYIEKKENEIKDYRITEKNILDSIYINQNIEIENAMNFSFNLFDREKSDNDFLSIRLGEGKRKADKIIDYKKQERLESDDLLLSIPESVSKNYEFLENAPIVCDLKNVSVLGIAGNIDGREVFFKNTLLDICLRQYYTDVRLFVVFNESNAKKFEWIRFLPHLFNSDLLRRNIICDDESKNILLEYLFKELTNRKNNKSFNERIVIFVYDDLGLRSHPVSKFLEKSQDLGVTFIFFAEHSSKLPQYCDYIIKINDNSKACMINTNNGESINYSYSTVTEDILKNIVKILAPVFSEEISLESSLTKELSYYDMMHIISVDDIDLKRNWQSSDVAKSMAVPLGVSKLGVVYLDLHDKAHGPHGLVAGTTGSGKSEILQTYILSISTMFSPYEVSFVIIDFKGGGMVNQFKNLPHLVGAITNIDGKEIDRSLKSIKAELQKRQRYFAEADVNHIDKYIKKFKAGHVKNPLPHLIIIVDEFAELKAEQPEFMKELISAARIGRSLGVHLILATQKPSGQVNEQIWSNSRFRLCLKVQDPSDSNEVIKSPLAAEIKEPGRAYLQVGNNEIFELFQSAYSGAPAKFDNNLKEFIITEFMSSGKKKIVYEQRKKKGGNNDLSQLDAIVNYIHKYCERNDIEKLPNICLPSLKNVIEFPQTEGLLSTNMLIKAEVGIYDDPDNQYQGDYSIDLASQNVMIIGSSQTGKTNLLQTIIRSLASKYSPKEVIMYIIDFASMILKNFEGLNHVGGVVTPSEDEKLKNLMKLLFSEIETRKEKLMSVGVSSFSAYKEAGNNDLPQIILFIDNLTSLRELYFSEDDDLLRLCREGLSVGISIVIANSQTTAIGYRYLSNFASKIALYCNDFSEYNSLFDYCSCRISNIPGRCIIELNKKHYECQSYLSFDGEKEFERVENIKKFVNEQNKKHTIYAKMIPIIPEVISKKYVEETLLKYKNDSNDIIFGIDYSSVSPTTLNFSKNCVPLVVSGRDNSGKSNFIKYIITTLNNTYSKMVEFYVFDNLNKKLSAVNNVENLKQYEILPDGIINTVLEIENKLKARYAELTLGNDSIINESPLLMLVINNRDALDLLGSDKNAYESFKQILKRYKNLNVGIIVGDFENVQISFSSPDIYKYLRDFKNVIFFDDLMNFKIFDLSLAVIKQYKKPIEIGDAYYIKEHSVDKVKTVLLN